MLDLVIQGGLIVTPSSHRTGCEFCTSISLLEEVGKN